ncbi:uncharacterized protein LOC135682952 isoform X2 [Rhopilema esculentum]|uniref:uncharacterized protein LOC135682952 isoform X2 n=1 Tax=Rhopilema esculentum TaxID=499914 RepID=UPI0031DAE772
MEVEWKIFWLTYTLSSVTVTALNKGQIIANETKSSPSHVTSLKGSSLWLTWGYQYGGDALGFITYKEQIIGFNSSSQAALQPVAKRTGANGVLQLVPTVPAPFTGRLTVIPSNDTLLISGLKYNDTAYQFASYIVLDVTIGGARSLSRGDLKPVVRITVNGVPEVLSLPPATVEVNENSNLEIAIEMDGSPAPSADFLWPHLGDGGTTVAASQIYPYVYSAKFTHPNIAATFCGRILKSSVKNSVGSSLAKDTYVTVLMKLDSNPNLQARKKIVDSCVEVKWTKAESGACYVKYEVKLKNASGIVVYTETGYNIDEIKKCKIPRNVNITDVEMTMSFKSTSKFFTAKVAETPILTTLPPTTTSKTSKTPVPSSSEPTTRIATTHKSTGKEKTSVRPAACKEKQVNSDEEKDNIIIALSVVVAVSFIAMATMVICLIRIMAKLTLAQDNGNKRNIQPKETHYMDLQGQTARTDSAYAGLQSPYEEIHDAARNYENTKHLSSVL